jgi:hypothetical protein
MDARSAHAETPRGAHGEERQESGQALIRVNRTPHSKKHMD